MTNIKEELFEEADKVFAFMDLSRLINDNMIEGTKQKEKAKELLSTLKKMIIKDKCSCSQCGVELRHEGELESLCGSCSGETYEPDYKFFEE